MACVRASAGRAHVNAQAPAVPAHANAQAPAVPAGAVVQKNARNARVRESAGLGLEEAGR